jgi:hypothetical protein
MIFKYKYIKMIGVVLFNVFLITSCSSNETKSDILTKKEKSITEKVIQIEEKDSIYIDTFFTDIAKTIGGIDNSFIQKRGLQSNFSQLVSNQFEVFTKSKIQPIQSWVEKTEMIPTKYQTKTLFYPLAGADFVYANAFFSNVDNYILVGLEKPGYLPNYDQLSNVDLQNYRSQIFNSLDVSMKSGFFRTNSMRVQFNQKTVNGTLHSLLFYLARTGNSIRKIRHFILKDDSTVKYTSGTEGMFSPGLDIEFLTADNKVKNLYYYNIDISDQNPKLDGFYTWVSSFGEHNTMLKAASYLNSRDYFSKTRNYILTSSNMVVQDDSGIPYKYFVDGSWDIKLYGGYKRVIRLFSSRIQPDMVKAYADTSKLTSSFLPFHIGYNVSVGETNLQVFYKLQK